MKKQLGLLVAIFGLAILTGCAETAEQGQAQEQVQQVEQVQEVQQTQEVAPDTDSTKTEATETKTSNY
jgi:outer membrane biogenesis lipoprotein LolB